MKGVSGGVTMELGTEDRVGNLEIVKCGLKKRDIGGSRKEEAENSNSGANKDGLAPAVLGAADGSGGGLGHW